MADNDMESISETTSVADISLTSTISDCSNSQNNSPVCRYIKIYFYINKLIC